MRLLGVADPAGARRAEDGQRRDGRGGGRELGRRGEARGRGGEEGGERGRRGGRRVEVGAALEELEAGFSEREGAREGRVEDEPAGGCERSADTLQQTLVLGRGTHRKPRRSLKNRRRPVIVVASDRSYSAARLATDCGETERMGTSSCDPGADHEVSSCDGRSAAVDEADVGRTGCSLRTRYTSSCDWSETRTDSADVMQPLRTRSTAYISLRPRKRRATEEARREQDARAREAVVERDLGLLELLAAVAVGALLVQARVLADDDLSLCAVALVSTGREGEREEEGEGRTDAAAAGLSSEAGEGSSGM